jgi:PmbA protein
MNEQELLEIGSKAVNHAQKLGADEAEIFLFTENQTVVTFVGGIFASRGGAVKGIKGTFLRLVEPWIKKKGLPIVTSGIRAGVGVRAVVNNAIGFSSVSNIDEKWILEATEEATKIAKIRPPDPNWVLLPGAKSTGDGGVFDKRVAELGVEEMLELCADCCVTVGDFDKRITHAVSMISSGYTSFGVVNTNGIEVSDKCTAFTFFADAKAKSGGEDVGSGDVLMSRSYAGDLRPIAINAAKRAIECFGKRALSEKYVGPVLFENVSWNELFSVIFTFGISALNVQENRSVYKGKIGNQVGRESISIVDNGTLPDGFGTTKIDDEGVPRQKTPIVEKGALSNILYDNYTAKRENLESTGNASRYRMATSPYTNQPTIRPTNLTILPDKGSLEDLMHEMKDGVLVKGSLIGALHSNAITGDFSVTADTAFQIENGEIAYPLKACTVAGNLYNALNHVTAIGSDSKTVANFVCPSLVIDKIVVST